MCQWWGCFHQSAIFGNQKQWVAIPGCVASCMTAFYSSSVEVGENPCARQIFSGTQISWCASLITASVWGTRLVCWWNECQGTQICWLPLQQLHWRGQGCVYPLISLCPKSSLLSCGLVSMAQKRDHAMRFWVVIKETGREERKEHTLGRDSGRAHSKSVEWE